MIWTGYVGQFDEIDGGAQFWLWGVISTVFYLWLLYVAWQTIKDAKAKAPPQVSAARSRGVDPVPRLVDDLPARLPDAPDQRDGQRRRGPQPDLQLRRHRLEGGLRRPARRHRSEAQRPAATSRPSKPKRPSSTPTSGSVDRRQTVEPAFGGAHESGRSAALTAASRTAPAWLPRIRKHRGCPLPAESKRSR